MELHLASMENISCWAFRKLYLGSTDVYTGILSLSYLLERRKACREIDTFPITGQRQWVQIATSKEKECAEFIKLLEEKIKEDPSKDNIYGIQLNLSCPSPNMIRIGQGPCLIKRVGKVASLVRELLKQNRFKVSVKTRLGFDTHEIREKRIQKLMTELEKIHAENPNFTQVVIHFKHAKEPSFTPYDYSLLKELSEFNIPIVINGGINNTKDFERIINKIPNTKNIAGFMIGREALKNPDCFVEASNILNKTQLKNRSQDKINEEFIESCKEHAPRSIYLNKINRLCQWYKY